MVADTVVKTYKIAGGEVEVCEDSYENGEGDYYDGWTFPSYEYEYDDIEKLMEDISDISDVPFTSNPSDYVYIDGRIDTDAFVAEDYLTPTDADMELWRDGEMTLYNAHLFCHIVVVERAYTAEGGFDDPVEHDMTIEDAEELGLDVC